MLAIVQAFPRHGWVTAGVTSHCFPPLPPWPSWRCNTSTAIAALGVRLPCLSQETTGHDPIAHSHYGYLPYLLPVAVTTRSTTQLPGSPVLLARHPPGICPGKCDSSLYCFNSHELGFRAPFASPHLKAAHVRHQAVVASPLGDNGGMKLAKLFAEPPLPLLSCEL